MEKIDMKGNASGSESEEGGSVPSGVANFKLGESDGRMVDCKPT